MIRGHDQPLSSTLTLAPSIAEMDQAAQWLASGRVIDRPGMFVNVPSLLDPTLLAAGRPAGHHVLSIEVLLTPFAHPGGWARSAEPQRWLELVDGICDNDLRGSIVDMRVMSPDVYEQQFHLPCHATSFAGGPLAALRTPTPSSPATRPRWPASISPVPPRSLVPASGVPAAATVRPSFSAVRNCCACRAAGQRRGTT